MNPTRGPVETKVTAGALSAAVVSFIAWVLDRYVFAGAIPDAVYGLLVVLVPGLSSFIAGYFARHTHRPDLSAPGVTPPVN